MNHKEFLEMFRKYKEYDYTLEEMRSGKVPKDIEVELSAEGLRVNGELVEDNKEIR